MDGWFCEMKLNDRKRDGLWSVGCWNVGQLVARSCRRGHESFGVFGGCLGQRRRTRGEEEGGL